MLRKDHQVTISIHLMKFLYDLHTSAISKQTGNRITKQLSVLSTDLPLALRLIRVFSYAVVMKEIFLYIVNLSI